MCAQTRDGLLWAWLQTTTHFTAAKLLTHPAPPSLNLVSAFLQGAHPLKLRQPRDPSVPVTPSFQFWNRRRNAGGPYLPALRPHQASGSRVGFEQCCSAPKVLAPNWKEGSLPQCSSLVLNPIPGAPLGHSRGGRAQSFQLHPNRAGG